MLPNDNVLMSIRHLDHIVLTVYSSMEHVTYAAELCVPCKNCSSSYIAETGRGFGLRIKEHKKKVDSFTAGTQTQASRARESNVTHKSAITDHAMEENHVIDWDKAKVRHSDRPDG